MWYPWRWTKVQTANIPIEARTRFEGMGVAVVSQAYAREITIPGYNPYMVVVQWGPPQPADVKTDRDYALAWLIEQHTKEERRRDIGESVEIAILILVAIEAFPVLLSAVIRCSRLISKL